MNQYTPEKLVAVSRYQNYFPTLSNDVQLINIFFGAVRGTPGSFLLWLMYTCLHNFLLYGSATNERYVRRSFAMSLIISFQFFIKKEILYTPTTDTIECVPKNTYYWGQRATRDWNQRSSKQ